MTDTTHQLARIADAVELIGTALTRIGMVLDAPHDTEGIR